MTMRKVQEIIKARPTSDGDGVKLLRVFGGQGPERFDPFLMLDEFGSEEARDYIGGFPPHPHRGFETITYMLDGKMEHRDHLENVGLLNDGDVQWMTAGSGIIHSEMPKQTEGNMRGFQFWLNLPADQKMVPPRYEDVAAIKIPVFQLESVWVKAIAGQSTLNGQDIQGYFVCKSTAPLIWDVHLLDRELTEVELPSHLNAMIYVYDGTVSIAGVTVGEQQLARLTDGDSLKIHAAEQHAKFLIIAGRPLKEPIAQYGPFVMNTAEQINQAIEDYQNGTLAAEAAASG